jgi:hypothetical protein
MTRAAHATLHGDLARAFRLNPVGMVLFPIGMAALSFQALGWIMERPPLLRFDFGPRFAWVIAWIMISFMVLRNIPYWPFTLLAPF